MALGEWLSVANARELATMQLAKEREEIEQSPEAEQHELALILQAKGIVESGSATRGRADHAGQGRRARYARARGARHRSRASSAAILGRPPATSFALFAAGAIFPILPYAVEQRHAAIVMSAALSALVLAAIGMLTSLFNGRSASYSALRQVAFGCLAAAVTFGVGRLLGVSLS